VSRIAVVTGGSSGLGAAIVCQLLQDDLVDEVIVLDLVSGDCAEEAVRTIQVDVTNERAVARAVRTLGCSPLLLVNNAGGTLSEDGDEEAEAGWPEVAQWRRQIDLNLTSPYIVTRSFLPALQPDGAICNVASIAGLLPWLNLPAYGAAKAGLIHWTRELALLLARRDIRVNAVAPGYVFTPLWVRGGVERASFLDVVRDRVPLSGETRAEDIASAVSFLCSPAAKHITGQILTVDGGSAVLGIPSS
jgi:3-oxoacyl-[acyl-carrier protein] reductase